LTNINKERTRLNGREWFGLIPPSLMIIGLFILWVYTGFQMQLANALLVLIMLIIYLFTHIFWVHLFNLGESNIKDDKELIKLEKDDSAML
jgi:hypothetical protein